MKAHIFYNYLSGKLDFDWARKKCRSRQVDFPARQVTFHANLPDGRNCLSEARSQVCFSPDWISYNTMLR